MTRFFRVLACLLCFNIAVKAAPGDTTWVQGTICNFGGFGAYDSSIKLPVKGKTYRKIYMIFTLGKYSCPGYDPANPGDGPGKTGWCGDWDYTVLHYIMTPDGKSLELGRMISPYANSLAPRTPLTWTQRYVYDVTDYASVLHDSAVMRIFYSGYSGGFTGNIKFAFIEGTPDRDAIAVHRLWNGSWGYGGATNINTHFTTVTDTAPEHTASATMKFTVTGHGSDAHGCCEFAPHSYDVLLNGGIIGNTTIWRDNCGSNELYPQSGTWLANRANWCPGATVYPYYYPLKGVTAGKAFTTSLQFEDYTGGGSYTTEAQLFFYSGLKKVLDASIDDIISPSNDESHFRENPSSGAPVIHIKNRGKATITAITFQYGLSTDVLQSYSWTGVLKSMEERDVTLPVLAKLTSLSDSLTHTYNFVVKIADVNGGADADATNNVMTSQFVTVPQWPTTFKINFLPNNEGTVLKPGISETSWIIYDVNDNIVKQRVNVPISVMCTDTISLPSGTYRLQIYDSSCDGLYWWYHAVAGDGVTGGSFFVRKMSGANPNIPMTGYVYSGSYGHDFGCGFTQYFTVNKPAPAGVNNIVTGDMGMNAYPNPATSTVNVEINGVDEVKGVLHVIDALGRVVVTTDCNDAHKEMNIASLANGVYTILYVNEATGNKLTTRLLIAK